MVYIGKILAKTPFKVSESFYNAFYREGGQISKKWLKMWVVQNSVVLGHLFALILKLKTT